MSAQTQTLQENKMGVMPVPKLLLTMGLPLALSMLIQALYNVVDSIFVSWIAEDALTAVSAAFPVQNLMIAVASGMGVGVTALLSRSLGEKNYEEVNRAATNGFFLSCLGIIAFVIFGIFGVRTFFEAQGADPVIVEYGVQYLSICSILCFGIFFQILFERLLQSTGKTFYTMISQGLGAVINIVLDPILIFGLGPFPELGVRGAALATIIGQIVAMIICINLNRTRNPEIQMSFKGFRPNGSTIKRIFAVGVPTMVLIAIGSVTTYALNAILYGFSSTAVSVYGVFYKLSSFIIMPMIGMNNAALPIVAYNYGAKKPSRMVGTIKLSLILAIIYTVIGFLIFLLGPRFILGFFDASPEMIEMGVPALQIAGIHFLFCSGPVIFTSVFQALGHGGYGLICSFLRQMGVIIPCAYFFSKSFGLAGVWWSYPLSELVALVLAIVFFVRLYRRLVKPLFAEEEKPVET